MYYSIIHVLQCNTNKLTVQTSSSTTAATANTYQLNAANCQNIMLHAKAFSGPNVTYVNMGKCRQKITIRQLDKSSSHVCTATTGIQ